MRYTSAYSSTRHDPSNSQLILEVALKDLRPGDVLETLAAGMQWKVGVWFRLTLLYVIKTLKN